MSGLNRACLLGHLGMDPELKYTQAGQAVLRLRLATTESYFDKKSNERKERTEWHTVIVWGPRAEGLNKFLAKGSKLYVEGSIQTRSWEDKKDGSKRYSTEINAREVIPCGDSQGGGQRQQSGGFQSRPSAGGGGGGGGYEGAAGGSAPEFEGSDDDIPF